MFGADPAHTPELTREAAEAFIESLSCHPLAWVIAHEDKFLGEIRLDNLDERDRRANLAIGLYDPRKLGKGLGREAIRLLVDHAFGALHLHRIGVRVVSFNKRALGAYRACGFVEEGRERQACRVGGVWYDDIIMGVLATDHR